MARILLVEDDLTTLSILGTLLKAEGYEVVSAASGETARDHLLKEDFDLMISDIFMKPINGRELLKLAHDKRPDLAVIMLTAHGSVETAIEALKLGAFDYVTKPFKVDELLITVNRALEYRRTMTENVNLRAQLDPKYRFSGVVAESAGMKQVCDMIERVAPTDSAVLILGEKGTGKELLARTIHAHSRRQGAAFVAVDCAESPPERMESELFGGGAAGQSPTTGAFQSANGGTLLLKSVESLSEALQRKVLDVMQSKELPSAGGNAVAVNIRVLASAESNLAQAAASGAFLPALHARLSSIPISIPPLRSRQEDVLPMVFNVLRQEYGDSVELPSLEPGACAALTQYAWPGNVRELENAIRHSITLEKDNVIGVDALPPKIAEAGAGQTAALPGAAGQTQEFRGMSLKKFLRGKEEEYLKQVLSATGGDKQKAAETLKISLATLYRKLPEGSDPKSQ